LRRFIFVSVLAVMSIAYSAPAHAGGAQFEPSWVRVDAGAEIELGAVVSQGAFGWVEDGPFYAYLSGTNFGEVTETAFGGAVTNVPLGELTIDTSGDSADVTLLTTVPAETPPGEYQIVVCNDPCTTGFGDLSGGALYIGVDPPSLEEVVTNVPSSTAMVAVDIVVPSTVAPQSPAAPAYLVLAPATERSTQISPLWIAFSAALGCAVLLASLLTRNRG